MRSLKRRRSPVEGEVKSAELKMARHSRAAVAPKVLRPQWVESLQAEANERFQAMGLPTGREEEWQWTPLKLFQSRERETGEEFFSSSALFDLFPSRSVFVNGIFSSPFSTAEPQEGVTVAPLSELTGSRLAQLKPLLHRLTRAASSPFVHWNTAAFADVTCLLVEKGVSLDLPIHLLQLAEGGGEKFLRTLILLEEGSRAQIVEVHGGRDPRHCLVNGVTEVFLGRGAQLSHTFLQLQPSSSVQLQHLAFDLGKESQLASLNIALGGKLSRCELAARLVGEGAEASLQGLFVGRGEQQLENFTLLTHENHHTVSQEHYRGIVGGRAVGVFDGKIVVTAKGQKTSAAQSNKNLLLSDRATVHTNPRLEIEADDVSCSHGAAIGQLDEEGLFYLRSRGVEEALARAMLVQGFAREVLATALSPVHDAALRCIEKAVEEEEAA